MDPREVVTHRRGVLQRALQSEPVPGRGIDSHPPAVDPRQRPGMGVTRADQPRALALAPFVDRVTRDVPRRNPQLPQCEHRRCGEVLAVACAIGREECLQRSRRVGVTPEADGVAEALLEEVRESRDILPRVHARRAGLRENPLQRRGESRRQREIPRRWRHVRREPRRESGCELDQCGALRHPHHAMRARLHRPHVQRIEPHRPFWQGQNAAPSFEPSGHGDPTLGRILVQHPPLITVRPCGPVRARRRKPGTVMVRIEDAVPQPGGP